MIWCILGSGPSLNQADVDLLRGRVYVCAVNNSHRLAPWANILYATDARWWRQYYSETLAFEGEKLTFGNWKAKGYDVEPIPMANGDGLGPPMQCGNNSVHAAISLVYNAYKATHIGLIGVDCQAEGERTHFFGGHTGRGVVGSRPYPRFINSFRALQRDNRGKVEITNLSRKTAVDCFPREDLETWLERVASSDQVRITA